MRPPSSAPFSASSCRTKAPKPPMAPSSTVIRHSCSRARRRIMSASSGLAKRASATVAETPRAASRSAAFSDSCKRVPSDRMATEVPSRTMRPLPISSGAASSGISTPTPSPRGYLNAEGRSSMAREVEIMAASSASSAAAISTMPGRAPMKPMSKLPAWVAPSAPTRPARSMAKRTGRDWIATSWTTWS
ncbi:hypothetical protein D3C86_1233970 [compost metagenome]